MNQRPEIVAKRDDALTRRAVLLTASGRAEEALSIMREHHFHNWEGSSSLHGIYVDACIQSGILKLRGGHPGDALSDFQAALDFPDNQEVGRTRRDQKSALIEYWIGTANERLGDKEKAQAAFREAADSRQSGAPDTQYCKALALEQLGEADRAKEIFQRLKDRGLDQPGKRPETADYFAKFGERQNERLQKAENHFSAALGCLGLGEKDAAQEQFHKTLELNPAHLGALSWISF